MVRSIFAPNLFLGRVALITGGGTGIGLRTAKEFMQLGGSVIIASRKAEVIAAAVQELNAMYPPVEESGMIGSSSFSSSTVSTPSTSSRPRCIGRACNIRDPSSIAALCDWISAYGLVGGSSSSPARVDFLVNNAGGQFPSLASDMSSKGWTAVIDTNLNGTFFMAQAIHTSFFSKQQQLVGAINMQPGGCAIVNVVANMHNGQEIQNREPSIEQCAYDFDSVLTLICLCLVPLFLFSPLVGFPGMSHTGAARAGVVNLTKSLAVEWSSAGVRVNAIAPGVIASSGLLNYDAVTRAAIATQSASNTYAYRLGTEAECAAAILFMLSPAGAFITGACLNMDGGESLYAPVMPPIAHTNNPSWDDNDTPSIFHPNAAAVESTTVTASTGIKLTASHSLLSVAPSSTSESSISTSPRRRAPSPYAAAATAGVRVAASHFSSKL